MFRFVISSMGVSMLMMLSCNVSSQIGQESYHLGREDGSNSENLVNHDLGFLEGGENSRAQESSASSNVTVQVVEEGGEPEN